MFNKLVLVLVSLFSVISLFAQHPHESSLNPLQGVLPPSPTAAALGTYGEIPVSLHTGIPNISIPLTTLEGGNLSLPIALSYHGGGNQVDAISSWVGLGWSLNAGGVITRTVIGIEDDEPVDGYWSKKVLDNPITNANPVSLQTAQDAEAFYNYLNNVGEKRWDAQPDLFNFNINGYSGRFFIEKKDSGLTPHIIPHQNIKIEPYIDPVSNRLTAFTLTTPDGIQYHFGGNCRTNGIEAVEHSKTSIGGGSVCGREYNDAVITSWYLREIIAPNNTDFIEFTYESHNYSYIASASETVTKKERTSTCGCCSQLSPAGTTTANCTQHLSVNGIHLTKIENVKGRVEFISTTQRDDIIGEKRLTELHCYGREGDLLRSFVLNQDYFVTQGTFVSNVPDQNKRLRLLSVTEKDASGTANPPYVLDYENSILPPRLSRAKDFWGYYNGQHGNTSLIPKDLPATPNFYPQGGNRNANFNYAKAGVLTKITYPTGGHTTLEYEGHERAYDAPISELTISTAAVYADYTVANTTEVKYNTFTLAQDQEVTVNYNIIHRCGAPALAVSFLKIEEKINGAWQPLTTTNPNIRQSGTGNEGKGTVDFSGSGSIHPTQEISSYSDAFQLQLVAGEYRITSAALNTCPNGSDQLDISIQYTTETGNLIYGEAMGGLRIKKIQTYDGLNTANDMTKTYSYQKAAAPYGTSGYAPRPANYTIKNASYFPVYHDLQNVCYTFLAAIPDCICEQPFQTFLSESQLPLNGAVGAHVAYSEVTVLEGLNGENGKTWNKFSRAENVPIQSLLGLRVPSSILDWRGGLLQEQIVYKNDNGNFIKVQEVSNQYETAHDGGTGLGVFHGMAVNIPGHLRDWRDPHFSTTPCNANNIDPNNSPGTTLGDGTYVPHPCEGYSVNDYIVDWGVFSRFNFVRYPIFYGWEKMVQTQLRQYDETGTDYIERITTYDYDNRYTHLKSTTTTNSDDIVYTTKSKYVTDYVTYTGSTDQAALAINNLKTQHQHNIPVEQNKYIQKVGQNPQLIGGTLSLFKTEPNGLVVPQILLRSKASTPISNYTQSSIDANAGFVYNQNVYEPYGNFLKHDSKGNILDYQRVNDKISSFIWADN